MEFVAKLHPLLVHFPIALLFSYFLLELGGIVFKKDFLHSSALIVLIGGVLFALVSALTGNQAFEYLKPFIKSKTSEVFETIELHEQFANITLWYFFVLMVLRIWLILKKRFSFRWKIICLLLGLIGCFLIIKTGLLGGQLVYEFGAGTKMFLK